MSPKDIALLLIYTHDKKIHNMRIRDALSPNSWGIRFSVDAYKMAKWNTIGMSILVLRWLKIDLFMK